MDLINFNMNQKPQLSGLGEPVTAAATIGLVAKIGQKLAPVIKKVANFFKGLVKNDNGVIAARDLLTAYIIGRFSAWSGSRSWSGSNRTVPDITDPLIINFKLRNSDIPNAKFGGNYDAEMERVANAMATYLAMYEPTKLQAFLDALPTYPKPDHAFLFVTTGKAGPWSRETLMNLPAFSLTQVQAAFRNAQQVGMSTAPIPITDPTAKTSFFDNAVDTYQTIRDATGKILQPGTPEYNQAIEHQQSQPTTQQAGFNTLIGIGAVLLIGGGLWYTASQAEKKKKKAG